MRTTSSPASHRWHSRGSRFPRFTKGTSAAQRQPTPVQQSTAPPYGRLLVEIEREELQEAPEDPRITATAHVASYTWLARPVPSIVVPGEPARWTPLPSPQRVPPDRGEYLRDPNAARSPAHPWDASCHAVHRQHPHFDPHGVDVAACSSVLGHLSRFVRGVERDFRFVMDRVGRTVFFIRRENSPTELIPDVRGYGHNFVDAYTAWGPGLADSASHQRLIRYDFGGRHYLVRFESDGFIAEEPAEDSRTVESDTSLADVAATLNIGPSGQMPATTGDLHVEDGGRPVAHGAVMDIKTRSMLDFKTREIKKEINMTDLTPLLWVSQIPTLAVAYHRQGTFEDVQVQDMRDTLAQWERDNETSLRKLISLINELVSYVQTATTSLEVCRQGNGPLEVRRVGGDGPTALSPACQAMWTASATSQEARGAESPRPETHPDSLVPGSDDGARSDKGS